MGITEGSGFAVLANTGTPRKMSIHIQYRKRISLRHSMSFQQTGCLFGGSEV